MERDCSVTSPTRLLPLHGGAGSIPATLPLCCTSLVEFKDAGQGWHTDMSYNRMIAFANMLYGIEIPHRDGQPLGGTSFCDMEAAYNELPEDMLGSSAMGACKQAIS